MTLSFSVAPVQRCRTGLRSLLDDKAVRRRREAPCEHAGEHHAATVGHRRPPGEIALSDLASLADTLQLLATRIGRQLVGQAGLGRTAGGAERATRLTLTGISEGSTRLKLTAGAADTLALDDPFEVQVMDRLWEVFGGLETGAPLAGLLLRSPRPQSRSSTRSPSRRESASSPADAVGGTVDASSLDRSR